jgi:hypothetical protein
MYTSLEAYQMGTGWESGSVSSNPAVMSAGSAAACNSTAGLAPCPTAYQLTPGSPTIGAGVDLTKAPYSIDVGTRDYYGNPLPSTTSGSGYSMGADGVN